MVLQKCTQGCVTNTHPHTIILDATGRYVWGGACLGGSPGSFLIWSLHPFSGLPLFRCPLKSCLYPCLSMLYLCIRQTWPNHLSLMCMITSVMDSGVNVSSVIMNLFSNSRRQSISKTSRDCISRERSVNASAPLDCHWQCKDAV